MTEREKQVYDALSAQCARREYCVSDIRRKALERLEFDAAAADAVVASLVADGYVDDRRYAAAFARDKSALSGWGSPGGSTAPSCWNPWKRLTLSALPHASRKSSRPNGARSATTLRAASSSSASPSPAATTTNPSALWWSASPARKTSSIPAFNNN